MKHLKRLLTVAIAALIVSGSVATSAQADTLVSNTGSNLVFLPGSSADYQKLKGNTFIQGFRTGPNPTGYRFEGLSIYFSATSYATGTLDVKLWKGLHPGALINRLIRSRSADTYVTRILPGETGFSASKQITLDPNTNYHVTVTARNTSAYASLGLFLRNSTGEDSDKEDGFSISDFSKKFGDDSRSFYPLKLSIMGVKEAPAPPPARYDYIKIRGKAFSQGFTTGSNAGGYSLEEVRLRFGFYAEGSLDITVREGSKTGSVLDHLGKRGSLSVLWRISAGEERFYPPYPNQPTLKPDTDYFLIVSAPNTADYTNLELVFINNKSAVDDGDFTIHATSSSSGRAGLNPIWMSVKRTKKAAPPPPPPARPAPPAITNLVATPGSGQITLAWTAPDTGAGPMLERYQMQTKEGSGSWGSWETLVLDRSLDHPYRRGSSVTHTVSGLTSGTQYYYRVRAGIRARPAANCCGVYSEPSNEASAVPTAPAPVAPTVPPPAAPPAGTPTAEFRVAPTGHDGRTRFTFELHFSENMPGLSYKTLRDSAFTIANGRVSGVRRLTQGSNQRWKLTVVPAGTQTVQITLPITTDCQGTGAVCVGNRPLSTPVEMNIPGPGGTPVAPPPPPPAPPPAPAITAEFRAIPTEHDGRTQFTLELHFSENIPGLSYKTLRDSAFTIANGRVSGARRLTQGSNQRWAVNVVPNTLETVTVHLPATTRCNARGAVCTPDRRKLAEEVEATIPGPPGVRIADASAAEGTDATLDFTVTLDRAAKTTVTMAYTTRNGSAQAGSDYTASSGTLSFAPGETTKTIAVPILDDSIDEGDETLTVWLSNATGARIVAGAGAARGTISNSDPLQEMWLSRFGRTAASHVIDAVSERLSEPLASAQVTVGGQRIDLARVSEKNGVATTAAGLLRSIGSGQRAPSLLGSTFHLSSEGNGSGGPDYTAWGRITAGGFDGEEMSETVKTRIDGDVTTGIVGADVTWKRWLAGVAVSASEGKGTFGQAGGLVDEGQGTVESSLTSVQPYARFEVNERVSAWGLLGFGSGEMTMTEAAHGQRFKTITRTDIGMRLGAAGIRGALLEADEEGGIDLALKADALLARFDWEKVSNEKDTRVGSNRLRLALDGSRAFTLENGAVLKPSVELGLRHDSGDAETGAGIELGGRLRYINAVSGLSVEASARTLIAHEASGFEEWGISGAIRLDPGASGRGLSFTLAPTLGVTSSKTEQMWSMTDARALGTRDEAFKADVVLNAEVGYGVTVGHGRFTGTPYAGLGLSESTQDYKLGWRLTAGEGNPFTLGLEGTRNESAGATPEHGVMLRGELKW